jgi:hypothetical protein
LSNLALIRPVFWFNLVPMQHVDTVIGVCLTRSDCFALQRYISRVNFVFMHLLFEMLQLKLNANS